MHRILLRVDQVSLLFALLAYRLIGRWRCISPSQAFTVPTATAPRSMRLTAQISPRNDDSHHPFSRQQEFLFEHLSRMGADNVASLGVSERAKRALLAEAVEDRIFDLTDEIDDLVVDSRIVDREKAVALAKEVKVLQIQYEELVSGKESSLLQSLEQVMIGRSFSEGNDGLNQTRTLQ